jgi:peptidoglycan hydrolase CwlO-like protein
MQLKLIRQAKADDLVAAQWALITIVEGTAGSTFVRYAAPAATEAVGDLLARARAGANGNPQRWAFLLGQGLPDLVAQLQAARAQVRGQVGGLQTQVELLEQRVKDLRADPLRDQVAALTAERARLLERIRGQAARITELQQALDGQQRAYEARLTEQRDEIAGLRALVARQQLKLNGLLVPEG